LAARSRAFITLHASLENHFLSPRQAILNPLHHHAQILQPFVVVAIEQAQIIGANAALHRSSAPRDAIDQHFQGRAEIDQQGGRRQRLHDEVVQSQIGRIIALAQVAYLVQGTRENMRVLIDRAIDDGGLLTRNSKPASITSNKFKFLDTSQVSYEWD
jgi:hypothetical protein